MSIGKLSAVFRILLTPQLATFQPLQMAEEEPPNSSPSAAPDSDGGSSHAGADELSVDGPDADGPSAYESGANESSDDEPSADGSSEVSEYSPPFYPPPHPYAEGGPDAEAEDNDYIDFLDEENGFNGFPYYDPELHIGSDDSYFARRMPCTCGGHHSGEPSEVEDEDSEYGDFESVCDGESTSFPQFTRLPPELRCHIWELYCPDLTMSARLLDFQVGRKLGTNLDSPVEPSDFVVYEGPSLNTSTRRIRKVLAVHNESRALALSALPDTLTFRWTTDRKAFLMLQQPGDDIPLHTGIVRFRKERDIVLFGGLPLWEERWENKPTKMSLDGFADHVQNAAFFARTRLRVEEVQDCCMTLDNLPNLKNVFYCNSCHALKYEHMRWVTKPSCRERTIGRVDAMGTLTMPELYCWLDPDETLDWRAPRRLTRLVRMLAPHAAEAGWKLLPMLYFGGKSQIERRDSIVEIVRRAKETKERERNNPNYMPDPSELEGSDESDDSESDFDDFDDFDDYDVYADIGPMPIGDVFGNDALLEFMLFGPLAGPEPPPWF